MPSLQGILVTAVTIVGVLLFSPHPSFANSPATPADIVRAVLAAPDNRLDYAQAKLEFDRIIDPSIKPDDVTAKLNKLAGIANDMAGAGAGERVKLTALQKLIYQAGPWNDGRPFSYDLADPSGLDIRHKLLSTYLTTRQGNCVSMPILFLILADRMGLSGAALADAPSHVHSLH